MKNEAYGPGWADCLAAIEAIDVAHGRRPKIVVTWPVRPLGGQRQGAWVVAVSCATREEGAIAGLGAQATFGPGGDHRSITAALYISLLHVNTQLDEKRARDGALAAS